MEEGPPEDSYLSDKIKFPSLRLGSFLRGLISIYSLLWWSPERGREGLRLLAPQERARTPRGRNAFLSVGSKRGN